MRKTIFFGLLIFLSMSVMSVWGWENEAANEMLLDAVRNQDKNKLNKVIENGANVDYTDSKNKSVLMYACEKQNYEIVKILLENGANPNSTDIRGMTPSMYAVKYCDSLEIIELLDNAGGVNLNQVDKEERTLLMYAAENNSDCMVKYLIDKGINTKRTDMYGNNAAMYAVKAGNIFTLTVFMDKQCVDWMHQNDDGDDVMLLACMSGNLEIVKRLTYARNTTFNWTARSASSTPLLIRLIQKRVSASVIKFVMNRCSYEELIDCIDEDGNDILYWAKMENMPVVQRTLNQVKEKMEK